MALKVEQSNLWKNINDRAQRILFSINEAEKSVAKRNEILQQFKKILQEDLFGQFITETIVLLRQKQSEQKQYETELLKDYHFFESGLHAISNKVELNIKIIGFLSISHEAPREGWSFFEWRLTCTCLALHYFLMQFNGDSCVAVIRKMFLDRSRIKCLEGTREQALRISLFRERLNLIETFNGNIGDDEEWNNLSFQIFYTCTYILDCLKNVQSLARRKIKTIYWSCVFGESRECTRLTVNIDGKKYSFSGLTAQTLYLVLQDPFAEISFDLVPLKSREKDQCGEPKTDNQAYGSIYRRLEEINRHFREFFTEYDIFAFLIQVSDECYSYRVNPLFANLVSPSCSLK